MKNINLIFEKVPEKRVKISDKRKPISIYLSGNKLNGAFLKKTIGILKFLIRRYKFFELRIDIFLGEVIIADKAVWLLFEAIIYYTFKNSKFKIALYMNIEDDFIYNHTFFCSILYKSLIESNRRGRELILKDYYVEQYQKKLHINNNWYRRFISREQFRLWRSSISPIYQDLYVFFNSLFEDDEWADELSELISELINNVDAHTESDCIVDIDVSEVQNKSSQELYKKVAIVVMNLSENCIYDRVMNNIKTEYYEKEDVLYEKIYRAEKEHKQFFDERYKEEAFYILAAFQNHVSSRKNNSTQGGGTGLALLTEKIKNTLSKTKDDFSYVLSGDRMILFEKELLVKDEDGLTCFNSKGNFIERRPEDNILETSALVVPGTIFHLMLIKE